MAVNCPLCGKEVSSHYYLGQHVEKKDDPLHNGEKAEKVKEETGNPENLVEEWKEDESDNMENDNEPEKEDSEGVQLNSVPITDKPADEPDYMPIDDVEVDGLSEKQIQLLVAAKDQGYSKIEDCDKPISQRDVK